MAFPTKKKFKGHASKRKVLRTRLTRKSLKDLPHEEEIVGCDEVLCERGERRLTIEGGSQHH
jgi:hypothetical protein